jgi:hypothetical protein
MSVRALLCSLSFFLIIYAGYQMVQFRNYVKATNQLEMATPLDIYVQLAIAMVIGVWGTSGLVEGLKPIKAVTLYNDKSYDVLHFSPEFATFNTRAKYYD